MKLHRKRIIERLQQVIEESPYHNRSEFCEAIGVSSATLSMATKHDGNRSVPKSILIGLASHGINIQWLLFGIGPMRITGIPFTRLPRLKKAELDALTQPLS